MNAGFDRTDAFHLISQIETELEKRLPGALPEVEARLTIKHVTIEEFKAAVLRVLGLTNGTEQSGGPSILQWNPCASDRLMFSATRDICDYMVRAQFSTRLRIAQQRDPPQPLLTPLPRAG